MRLSEQIVGGIPFGHRRWFVETVSVDLPEDHPFYGRDDIKWHSIGAITVELVGCAGTI